MRLSIFFSGAFVLIFVIIGGWAVASPTDSEGNTDFWFHLDPVKDKHINESFVITGTTNIPAGENADIVVYSTRLDHRKNPPPKWYREYSVTILSGTKDNNTFSTPVIWLTPSRIVDGTPEQIWPGDEYLVVAKYKGDTSIEESTFFMIDNSGVSPTVMPLRNIPGRGELTDGIPPTAPLKSQLPSVLVIFSLSLICMIIALKKK